MLPNHFTRKIGEGIYVGKNDSGDLIRAEIVEAADGMPSLRIWAEDPDIYYAPVLTIQDLRTILAWCCQ